VLSQVLDEQEAAEPLVMCVDDDEVNHIVLEGMLHSQNYRCGILWQLNNPRLFDAAAQASSGAPLSLLRVGDNAACWCQCQLAAV
jgi:hypothetical protein